ncbi:VanZ family protein [Marinobacter halotolerans]|uniref:VanZ family protein n=1 Tax=Marinobacter halotolerans TaxID=1569211 RepID=UPI0012444A5B|nr:VanZ family protein [Marinobacter halotolerans]
MSSIANNLQRLLRCQPFWRTGLVLSAMVILFLATTSEPYPIPSASSDKINHLLAFIQLTVVTRLAWPYLSRIWVALGVLGFGLLIEITQAFLPHREFSLLDLATDGGGIVLGLLPCRFIFNREPYSSGR